TQVVGRSVDGFTVGFPTDVVYDGREAMVAVGMNGEPLPLEHGFPARLVVAGLYGYVSATKWLTELELTTWESFDAYWVPRGWSKEGPIKTQSRIDTPRAGQTVGPGERVVAGVAWAPNVGIERVEVQVDDEPWVEAELSEPLGDEAWRQWRVGWVATPGRHVIKVRATDRNGVTQTDASAPPAPDSATGWHTIRVLVEACGSLGVDGTESPGEDLRRRPDRHLEDPTGVGCPVGPQVPAEAADLLAQLVGVHRPLQADEGMGCPPGGEAACGGPPAPGVSPTVGRRPGEPGQCL